MNYFAATIASLFGLFIGSFLNVVALRFGNWKSIALTRSHCPHCKHNLAWYELIPLISFLLLRARCKNCKKPISWRYPAVELVCGVVTGLIWYIRQPINPFEMITTLLILIFCYVLLVMSLQDIEEMAVSDGLFITLFIVSVVYIMLLKPTLGSIGLGILGSTGLLLLLVVISKEQWMGWGDVFLAVPVGIVLGFPLSLLWIYVSFIIGAVWGGGLLLLKIKSRKDPVPFVPILALSFVIVYVAGNSIINWYIGKF